MSTTVRRRSAAPVPGMILGEQEFAKAVNSAVFPGQQGGPLVHVITGKAVAGARSPPHADSPTVSSARCPAPGSSPIACWLPMSPRPVLSVVSSGTDVHLVLIDLRNSSA